MSTKNERKKNKKLKIKEFKLKKTIYLAFSAFFIIIFIAGIGVGSFGLGWQSLRFTKTFRSVVRKNIDPTHLVIDADVLNKQTATGGSKPLVFLFKNAYIIDALSTLTNDQMFANGSLLFHEYRAYAIAQFNRDYLDTGYISNVEPFPSMLKNINILDFINNIFTLDLNIGKKFVGPLLQPGIQWMLTSGGINDLLANDWKDRSYYQYAKNAQTVLNQAEYSQKMNDWVGDEVTTGLLLENPVKRDDYVGNIKLKINKSNFIIW